MYLTTAEDITDNNVLTVPEETDIDEVRNLVGASGSHCKYIAVIAARNSLRPCLALPS